MVPTWPLFASATWKTLPRVRVLLLRLFGSSLFAPAAVGWESLGNKGVFGSVIPVAHADPCARTRSRALAPERRGSSCCVTGSLEFGSLSGGNASVPHPLNATEVGVRAAFPSGFSILYNVFFNAKSCVLLLFGCCAVKIAHETLGFAVRN